MFIPKVFTDLSGSLSLKLTSTVNLTYEANAVLDLDTSDLYYRVAVTLPSGMPDGEYEYELTVDNEVASTGVVVLVEESEPTQYNKTIEYEQYEYE